MPKLGEKGVIAQVLILLILVAGLGAGLYLVKHPQFFKPKATSVNETRVEFVDLSGNTITTSDSASVKVRLVYVAPEEGKLYKDISDQKIYLTEKGILRELPDSGLVRAYGGTSAIINKEHSVIEQWLIGKPFPTPSPTPTPLPTPLPTSSPTPQPINCHQFDLDIDGCVHKGGSDCAWYACSGTCWPRGTDQAIACLPSAHNLEKCRSQKTIDSCNATSCAWYACSNSCWPGGTSNQNAGCVKGVSIVNAQTTSAYPSKFKIGKSAADLLSATAQDFRPETFSGPGLKQDVDFTLQPGSNTVFVQFIFDDGPKPALSTSVALNLPTPTSSPSPSPTPSPTPSVTPTPTPAAVTCGDIEVQGAIKSKYGREYIYIVDSEGTVNLKANVTPENSKVVWNGANSVNLPNGGKWNPSDQPVTVWTAPRNSGNQLEGVSVRADIAGISPVISCKAVNMVVKPSVMSSPSPSSTPTPAPTSIPQFSCNAVTVDGAIRVKPPEGRTAYYVVDSRAKIKLTAQFVPPDAKIEWKIVAVSKNLPDGGNLDKYQSPFANYTAPQNNSVSQEGVTLRADLTLGDKSVSCEDITLAINSLPGPKITSVSPNPATAGDLITIKGTNFLPLGVDVKSLQVWLVHKDGGVAILAAVTGFENDPKVAKPGWEDQSITFTLGNVVAQSGQLKVLVNKGFRSWPADFIITTLLSPKPTLSPSPSSSPLPTPTSTPAPTLDINGDGVVTLSDVSLFISKGGVDLDGNGVVNSFDYKIMIKAWIDGGRKR